VQRGPREPAPWPHQVGALPPPASSFQHRAEADQVREAVAAGGTAVLCQVLAGMGGVGKTQLAADYARTAQSDGNLDVLVWATATTRQALVAAFAQAGVELCRADPNDPNRAATTFLAWLQPKAEPRPCRWLIVLDDLTDPVDLRGLRPPPSPHGRTLITTRRRDAALTGAGHHVIPVRLFTPAQATSYLTEALAAHGRTEAEADLRALADDLGHLPLALSQAAAYITDAAITVPEYRALLTDRTTTLADTAPDTLPDDQPHTVSAALTLSLDRADTLRPAGLARPLLHLAAYLDPNGIPATVLTSEPARNHLTQHRAPGTGPAPVTVAETAAALRTLHRLHLIDHDPDNPHQTVRVHQLTQRAVRDTLTPTQHHTTTRTAADALLAVWPHPERDTTLAQALRTTTIALTRHAEQALLTPDAHGVLFCLGRSLGESGQATAARDHYQHLAGITHQHLGPEHPDTLTTRSNLAYWRGRSGDAVGAAEAFEVLLEDRLRVLGPDHPNTQTTRNNLAGWREVVEGQKPPS
jgi:hypothetical protein